MSRPRIRIPAHIRERIGKTTDAVIARELNCSIGFVQQYRVRHNIPAFGNRASSVAPAPAVVQAPMPVEGPVEEKPATLRGAAALHKALSAARPAKGGMVIPYDLFAAMVSEVL